MDVSDHFLCGHFDVSAALFAQLAPKDGTSTVLQYTDNDQQRIKKELFLFLIHDRFTIVFCFDFTCSQPSISVYFNDLDWRNQRDLLEYNPDQPVDSDQNTKTGLKDLIHISTSSIPFFELF